ncbi:predicted protein [Chaetomium globosum CBS 148.51]|uniref:Uncharacterized protein n=1 Tax=Chaetomium globosum (strain ATCC 6205 / CBS 148.51 / DSM 1962 / NBRC 6347 / NRRL 1970) TaxID=306901 RepID=Q2H1T5_CHAGB|nr:uncharacterized protein CHGG_04261 [Chaetomium globosum CBS 148.51]EAQ87642.1 predicted protein [Chaetomium globosum CBS 148.51]
MFMDNLRVIGEARTLGGNWLLWETIVGQSDERAQRLQMAEAPYARAKQEFDRLMTIDNLRLAFANRTSELGSVKQESDNHDLLLRWVLEQVPLVEAEQNEADRAKASPTDVPGRKRALNSDESTGEPGPKRAREPSSPSASPALGELDANVIAGGYRTAAGHKVRISGAADAPTKSKPSGPQERERESPQEHTVQIPPKPANESPPEGKAENMSDPRPTAEPPQLPRKDEGKGKKGPTRSSLWRAAPRVALPQEQLGGRGNDRKGPAMPTQRSSRFAGIAPGAVVGVAAGHGEGGGAARGKGRGGRRMG